MYVTRSMSRARTPTDNGAMEAINSWIKTELFMNFHVTRENPAETELDEYITFLIGYLTPKQYKELHAA